MLVCRYWQCKYAGTFNRFPFLNFPRAYQFVPERLRHLKEGTIHAQKRTKRPGSLGVLQSYLYTLMLIDVDSEFYHIFGPCRFESFTSA